MLASGLRGIPMKPKSPSTEKTVFVPAFYDGSRTIVGWWDDQDDGDDLIVTAPITDAMVGSVFIFKGSDYPANPVIDLATTPGHAFLSDCSVGATATVGDLNGDGFADLVIVDGHPSVRESVAIFFGPIAESGTELVPDTQLVRVFNSSAYSHHRRSSDILHKVNAQ